MPVVEAIKEIKHIEEIERYLYIHSKRNHLIWLICVNTGLKVSEVLGLNVADVKDLDYIRVNDRKTGMVKRIYLNDKVKKHLYKYLTRKPLRLNEPLFKGYKGYRLDRSQVYRFINNACRCCGVSYNVGTMSMKKTFLYQCYQLNNNDITLLQLLSRKNTPRKALTFIGVDTDTIDVRYPLTFTI